jgi:hypothetical protein
MSTFARFLRVAAVVATLISSLTPLNGAAQTSESDLLRFGVSLGSTAFLGVSVEYVWDQTGLEVSLGTWSFHDFSIAVSGKQYLGEGVAKGFVGLGIWNVTAFQSEGTGTGLIVRAPVGAELETFDRGVLGVELNLSRAVWVKRADPEDRTPPRDRVVPLPGFYYKWAEVR